MKKIPIYMFLRQYIGSGIIGSKNISGFINDTENSLTIYSI